MESMSHISVIRIVSVSTLSSRSEMSLLTCIGNVLKSLGLNPTCDPAILTASHSALLISVLYTVEHWFLGKTTVSGMWPPAPFCHRCSIQR